MNLQQYVREKENIIIDEFTRLYGEENRRIFENRMKEITLLFPDTQEKDKERCVELLLGNSYSLNPSSLRLNENNFFGGADIVYFIAFFVLSLISIADLSCFPHASHLNPLSFILKYVKLSFSLQLVHDSILGVYPKIHSNLNLNILIVKSKSLSVSDIVYNAFKYNCIILKQFSFSSVTSCTILFICIAYFNFSKSVLNL